MANIITNTIKESIKEKGLTEEEFAKRMKLETSMLIAFEVGVKFPTIDCLRKMCIELDKTADELYIGTSREPLNLNGLAEEQKKIIRLLYIEMKK